MASAALPLIEERIAMAAAAAKEKTMARTETLLRCACVAAAAAAALLLGLSAQTKTVLFIRKTAMAKDVEALWVLVMASAAASAYHAARLLKRLCLGRSTAAAAGTCRSRRRAAAWISFLLDKGCAYLVFASSAAALQACFVALIGVEPLQWSKLCNIYTHFCEQAAAGMVCSLAAAAGMAVLSAFSARDLFRLYPRRAAGHAAPRAALTP